MIYRVLNNDKKEWLILIHCICGTEKIFQNQFETLCKRYNLVIIRLAGHDIKSQIEECTINYTMEEINDFVTSNNIIVDIIGISLGAMIASTFVARYPQKARNAYLVGTIYGFSVPLFKQGYMLLTNLKKLIPRSFYMFFLTYIILPGKNEIFQRKKYILIHLIWK